MQFMIFVLWDPRSELHGNFFCDFFTVVIVTFTDTFAIFCVHTSILLQGCGKSVLVQQFANFVGYNIEPVVLYQVNVTHYKY